ncbi:ribosome-associated translation inhibitor RaiA [Candidatus Dojkabacteria bacterium]|nr:ribosome-associated translation inhibitor RaiA [Candidatus Dojkabacteria bacterium]
MALKIDVYSKDLELTDRINEYVIKKVSRLERYLNEIGECRVDLSYIKTARNASDRHVAQLTIRGKGFILRAEERADNIFASIDESVEKMTRQIERFKGKHWRNRGDGVPAAGDVLQHIEQVEEEPELDIVRRKSFALIPMSEQEALEQMQLLGHENFFVFYNAETSKINVLYKRRDGTFGLIDPIVS